MTKKIMTSYIIVLLSVFTLLIYIFLLDKDEKSDFIKTDEEVVDKTITESWSEDEIIIELDKRFNEDTDNVNKETLEEYYDRIRAEFE